MKHQFLVVNGILSQPSDINGWTDLFEDYYQNEGYGCTKYEYFSGAITRFMGQGKRVQELNEIVKRINFPLVYVGHSNGCELFGRLMKDTECKFEAAHLFAPAMDSDFNVNGLNYGLLADRVKKVYLYCSKKDLVLKDWASKTSFLKFIGLGYGTLGYSGPKNVLKQVDHRIDVSWNNRFNHSDWFRKNNIQASFDSTLRK
jgi:hypothetical protein